MTWFHSKGSPNLVAENVIFCAISIKYSLIFFAFNCCSSHSGTLWTTWTTTPAASCCSALARTTSCVCGVSPPSWRPPPTRVHSRRTWPPRLCGPTRRTRADRAGRAGLPLSSRRAGPGRLRQGRANRAGPRQPRRAAPVVPGRDSPAGPRQPCRTSPAVLGRPSRAGPRQPSRAGPPSEAWLAEPSYANRLDWSGSADRTLSRQLPRWLCRTGLAG